MIKSIINLTNNDSHMSLGGQFKKSVTRREGPPQGEGFRENVTTALSGEGGFLETLRNQAFVVTIHSFCLEMPENLTLKNV